MKWLICIIEIQQLFSVNSCDLTKILFKRFIFLFFSLRVVDISDEMTDMEMSNNDSSDGDKGVIVSEVNLTKRPNNKDSSTRVRLTTQHGQRQSE